MAVGFHYKVGKIVTLDSRKTKVIHTLNQYVGYLKLIQYYNVNYIYKKYSEKSNNVR